MADYLRIIPASSNSAGFQPAPNEIQTGELALNTADAVLYTKTPEGTVVPIVGGTGASGSAGGDYGYYAGAPDPQAPAALAVSIVNGTVRLSWPPAQTSQGACSQDQGSENEDTYWMIETGECGGTNWTFVAQVPLNRYDLILDAVPKVAAKYCISRVTGRPPKHSMNTYASVGCDGVDPPVVDPPPPVNPPPPPYKPPVIYPPLPPTQPPQPPVVDPPPTNPQLDTRQGWQCFGNVTAGQTINITASGTVMFKAAADQYGPPYASPDGITGSTYNAPDGIAPGFYYGACSYSAALRHMAIIGTIGIENTGTTKIAGTTFLVGSSYSATATRSGALCLRVNDTCQSDNSGSFNVMIDLGVNPAP